MDQIDQTTILKKLIDYKNHPPATLYQMLDTITNWNQNRLLQNKLYQAVSIIAHLKEIPNTIFKSNEYEKLIEKAKQTLKILKQPMEIEKSKPEPIKKYNLFSNYQQEFSGYIDRIQHLNVISNLILNTYKNWNSNNKEKLASIDKIKEVTIGLEKQIYMRNAFKESRKLAYEMDIKTLIQYMRRDKSGDVMIKVFDKSLSYEQASLLKSEDWIDEKTKQVQKQAQNEELEINQIGFYREVAKREMDGVIGKMCKGCKQQKVYLVEEKMTRAADEPTTKFFECLNCGDKFRI